MATKMPIKKFITANEAVAQAARLAHVDVVAAYPITPQTSIVEKIAEYIANGEMDADYLKVESEHSALTACMGVRMAGARASPRDRLGAIRAFCTFAQPHTGHSTSPASTWAS